MSNVICMKWGDKYGPEYVNRLYSMVKRHLSLAHRFVCFTDDATGLSAGIEALPLPEMNLPPGKERGWRKLSTFTAPLADLEGPTLFLDIDVVIVGSLDGFFEHPGEFCVIRDYVKDTGNTSVYRFTANAHPDILETFLSQIDRVKAEVRNEQEYLVREMRKKGLVSFWPDAWCPSFKHNCLPTFPLNLFRTPTIPLGAKVIVFHGHPHPNEALAGKGKGLIRYVRPTTWIADHWK